jgi:uncharacterized protein YyaL (SSP411 family)
LTGDAALLDKATRTLELFRGLMQRSPTAAGQMLTALDFWRGPVKEMVVVGEAAHAEVMEVLRHLRRPFRPHQVISWKAKDADESLPLLKDKKALGAVTTYVCENFACQAPLVGVSEIKAKT